MTVDAVAWLIYGCARHGREEEVELWDCQRPKKESDPNGEMEGGRRPVGGREGIAG
jgi:hypothetical protein